MLKRGEGGQDRMTESEVGALLDTHEALVRSCLDDWLGFDEFLAAYGDFPPCGIGCSQNPLRPPQQSHYVSDLAQGVLSALLFSKS